MLLNLAKNIFEDTECLETVVRRIMTQAQELLECERCTVYIVDRSLEDEEEDVRFFTYFSALVCLLYRCVNVVGVEFLEEACYGSEVFYRPFKWL